MQHKARKRFGQNFLIDQNIINKIIAVINPRKGEKIVEIGPGLGALTQRLLPLLGVIDVIEIDDDIIPKLKQQCECLGELNIHHMDVLQVDFNQLAAIPAGNCKPELVSGAAFLPRKQFPAGTTDQLAVKLRIVGNLPYNISTPLLFHLAQYQNMIIDMHFMLQKEVVDRICASCGTKQYGRLSVMLQYYFKPECLFNIPPSVFRPQPKVYSSFLRLTPRLESELTAKDEKKLGYIVTQAFGVRRKTIRNALKKDINLAQFGRLNIDPNSRAEVLTLHDFINLSNLL